MNEIQKEINRLSNLVQNKGKEKSSLEEIAQKYVWKMQIEIEYKFEESEDKKLALSYFDAYRLFTSNDRHITPYLWEFNCSFSSLSIWFSAFAKSEKLN